ncbi:MAG TPA: hypothetical protein VFQ95_06795 [Rhodanobacteraceae bacterium]|nr:hypothetical protein [Rhodanobacteraceae bacterium]
MLLLALAAMVAAQTPAERTPPARQLLTTRYEAGHFYMLGTLAAGGTLRLLVDSGGAGGSGWYVIDPQAAHRLGLKTARCTVDEDSLVVVPAIEFAPGQGWPKSAGTPCDSTALVVQGISEESRVDGVIGAGYMPRYTWTFDYPSQKLWLEPAGWTAPADMHRAKLGYLTRTDGSWGTGFARLRLEVAGEALDLLLDTGATAKPSAAGLAATHLATVHGYGVTSYITRSVLERWHRQHPAWRVVEAGDDIFGAESATRLIEVPTVRVAGWEIGPVWFTEREDVNFNPGISQYTDQRVEGSAGANIFAHFVMTLDYPHGAAWFACRVDCRPADGAGAPAERAHRKP